MPRAYTLPTGHGWLLAGSLAGFPSSGSSSHLVLLPRTDDPSHFLTDVGSTRESLGLAGVTW